MPASIALTRLNWATAAAHALAAVLSLTLLSNRKVQVYETAYTVDAAEEQADQLDLPQALRPSGKYASLKALTVAFFAITAAAHVFYATDALGTGWYSHAVLGFGWNPFRWLEYSASAGIMIYVISLVAGSKERTAALAAALIVPGLMFQGLTIERELQQNLLAAGGAVPVDPYILWGNLVPAWALYAVKWVLIFSGYRALKRDVEAAGQQLDSRITALVYSQLLFFTLFGVVQTAQTLGWAIKAPNAFRVPYLRYEVVYILLSLVAKVGLGLSVANAL